MAEQQGKRVAKPRKKTGLKVFLVLFIILVAAYAAICFWVMGNGQIMPGRSLAGISVEGMNREAFDDAIGRNLQDMLSPSVGLVSEDGKTLGEFSSEWVILDNDALWDWAYGSGREMLFTAPLSYFLPQETALTPNKALLNATTEEFSQALHRASNQFNTMSASTTYARRGNDLVITKGTGDLSFSETETQSALLSAFLDGRNQVQAVTTQLSDEHFDVSGIVSMMETEAKNASFDTGKLEIIPHVDGISLDKSQLQAAYDTAAKGETFSVPLTISSPEITTQTLEDTLFRDVLGFSDTKVGGVANRVNNVRLMAEQVNEYIMLPGEVFSYLDIYNNTSGLLDAPAYVQGETKDERGGGICQVSSMLYYCAFHANLNIVNRSQHTYLVGYIKDGLDATVWNPGTDFKFENDTDYPIKIVSVMTGRDLHIEIQGTKTDDYVVSFDREYYEGNPYVTVYEFDESIPIGTTKEDVSGYNGTKLNVYKIISDGEGNVISRELESKNNYRRRDRILLINPADAALYGLEPPDGTVLPVPDPTEEGDPVTPTPGATEEPVDPIDPSPAPTEGEPEVTPPEEPTTPDVSPEPSEEVPTLPPVPEGIPVS